jgi:uncharacterized membrane protein
MAAKRSARNAAWFLLTRGFVLVVFEMTLVRWGWYFNWDYQNTSLQILWSIGVSMMGLAPPVFLPSRFVGVIGLAIVALHNLLGNPSGNPLGLPSWLWALLYERGRALAISPRIVVTVNFPVLPLLA